MEIDHVFVCVDSDGPEAARLTAFGLDVHRRARQRQRPAGLTELVGVDLELPSNVSPAPMLQALADAGALTVRQRTRHAMDITIARVDGGVSVLSLPDCTWAARA